MDSLFSEKGLLKGNTGCVFGDDGKLVAHYNAPYDSNGMVFALIDDTGELWDRMTREAAEREGFSIVSCSKCSEPAAQMDHLWPYYMDDCLCVNHQSKGTKR